MVSGIVGINYKISKANRTDGKIQNLAVHINTQTLRTIHRQMKSGKAIGIDNVTREKYEENLTENLENLLNRMKKGMYRPKLSRRTYIPKDGNKKMRPLGISCYEDKIVENAISQILTLIYEMKFINTSY